MSDIDLESKFPNMRPVRSAPSLFTVNGIGLTVSGSRDFDDETSTYVTTHCICVVFIPVLAIGAYRVANAPNGAYYFIGREPLSAFARTWNLALLTAVLMLGGFFWWHDYTG